MLSQIIHKASQKNKCLKFCCFGLLTSCEHHNKPCRCIICCVMKNIFHPSKAFCLSIFSFSLSLQANEYACGSYQNTMSRRSLFGAYSHQPNMSKYSYPSDVSLSSHYGYTSWGLWRDTGHLSPSIYSKKRINIRSFSILIMSAAFIVLLAVLSVAALAFYFSTFKSDPSDCKSQ
jgi:hypothetical protein